MSIKRLLCFIGIHNYLPAAVVRPETASNPLAAVTVICTRCGRLNPA